MQVSSSPTSSLDPGARSGSDASPEASASPAAGASPEASTHRDPVRGASRGDFDYALPPELIAQEPLPERSASRLLVLDGGSGRWRDARMRQLPQLLAPGDLLVLNDTRVLPARLPARKLTGGRLELLLERPLAGRRALVQLRDSRAVRAGLALQSAGGRIELRARQGEFWEVELPEEAVAFFERHGQVPLPPYIERPAEASDRERYQSVWARVPGAVAAPTASLHFDEGLLHECEAREIGYTYVTLHVAAGTFQPMRTEALQDHVMHAERYRVGEAAVAAIARARAAGGRVIAVGTTVARALESAALEAQGSQGSQGSQRQAGPTPAEGPSTASITAAAAAGAAFAPTATAAAAPVVAPLAAAQGDTRLFIHPGFRFRVVDALLTNFHLPQSTLLMLVAAFAGRPLVLQAYAHAVRERYRFYSYGDAMLVWPSAQARPSEEARPGAQAGVPGGRGGRGE